jgi:hypothetical protein
MIYRNSKKAFGKDKNICKIIIKYKQEEILYLNSCAHIGISLAEKWPRMCDDFFVFSCYFCDLLLDIFSASNG